MFIIKLFILILFSFVMKDFSAQAKLVVNGGIINITNGSSLVVNDSNTSAITRVSGHIISEGESNKLIWNTATTVGSYIIPFGYGATDYIPVSFTKTAGTGNGAFEFSTYRTATWQNSSNLPSLVGHLNNSSGSDNSAKVIDRFWQLNAVNYSTKPSLSDVSFTYLDAEHTVASNSIAESNLKAQRWNDASSSWGDFGPLGTVNTTNNTVFITSILSTHLQEWWTLVDNSSPLPVEFSEFNVVCNEGATLLEWTTASEINNDYFSVERSSDSENWETIETITGIGNSSQISLYSTIDESPLSGVGYYRIRQTDFNGEMDYSETLALECEDENSFSISVYPNPSNGIFTLETFVNGNDDGVIAFEIINMHGKLIKKALLSGANHEINLSSCPKGIYFLRISNSKKVISKKLMVQ